MQNANGHKLNNIATNIPLRCIESPFKLIYCFAINIINMKHIFFILISLWKESENFWKHKNDRKVTGCVSGKSLWFETVPLFFGSLYNVWQPQYAPKTCHIQEHKLRSVLSVIFFLDFFSTIAVLNAVTEVQNARLTELRKLPMHRNSIR